MKKYLFKRILFSLFSLVIVIGVVIILIYNLINRNGILLNDPNYSKVSNNEQIIYKYQRFQEYGYIYYDNMYETSEYINLSSDEKKEITAVTKNVETLDECIKQSPFCSMYVSKMKDQGYTVSFLPRKTIRQGRTERQLTAEFLVATRERSVFERIGNLFANLFSFETIWDVKDPELTNRYIRLEWDNYSNMPALVGSGTTHKYLIYFDNKFPFVHQNIFHIKLGKSFILQKGSDVVEYMKLRTGDRVTSYKYAPKDVNNPETYNLYSTFGFVNSVAPNEAANDTSSLEAVRVALNSVVTKNIRLGDWVNDNAACFYRAFSSSGTILNEDIISGDTIQFSSEAVTLVLYRLPAGSKTLDESKVLRKTDQIVIDTDKDTLEFVSWDKRILTGLDFHTVTYKPGPMATSDLIYYSADEHYANALSDMDGFTRIGLSFIMGIAATIITYIIGLPLGIWMAQRKDKLVDKIGNLYIIFIMAVPALAYIFMLASFGIAVFNLPYKFALAEVIGLAFIMPIISLSLKSIGGLMKWMRRYMVDQQNSDYVKFARSQGLSEGEIFSKHISRNALIYLVHSIPADILACLTGAIITERVYGVPGIGNMLTEAINKYDNSVIVGVTIFYTTLTIVSLILGDVLLAKYDPRISLSSEKN